MFQEEVEEESVEVFKIPIMQKGQELQICDFELLESKTKETCSTHRKLHSDLYGNSRT